MICVRLEPSCNRKSSSWSPASHWQTVSSSSIVELLSSAGPSNTGSRSAGVTSAHVALSGGVVLSPGAVVLVVGRDERAGSERSSPSSLHAVAASTPTSTSAATPVRRMHPIWERRYRLPMTTTERPKLNWRKSETHGLAPDPEPRPIRYTLISVDDHLVEPPDMFDGRLPARLAGPLAPKVVETDEGHEVWEFDGQIFFQVGLNAVVGRTTRGLAGRADPLRRDAARLLRHRRPRPRHGHQRRLGVGELPVADHRLLRLGVLALLRPRARPRGDARVERLVLRGVVLAASRSASCRWASRTSPTPSRARPRSAATRRAGFTAVTLPEQPHRIGMEPIFSAWWDPIIDACAETDTVICLHVGSTRRRRHAARARRWCRSARRCSASSRSTRARSGCGRATPCGTPT